MTAPQVAPRYEASRSQRVIAANVHFPLDTGTGCWSGFIVAVAAAAEEEEARLPAVPPRVAASHGDTGAEEHPS